MLLDFFEETGTVALDVVAKKRRFVPEGFGALPTFLLDPELGNHTR